MYREGVNTEINLASFGFLDRARLGPSPRLRTTARTRLAVASMQVTQYREDHTFSYLPIGGAAQTKAAVWRMEVRGARAATLTLASRFAQAARAQIAQLDLPQPHPARSATLSKVLGRVKGRRTTSGGR
jgi:hypothetical protein